MKKIGFLVVDDRKLSTEEKAAWAFLSNLKNVRSERIGFSNLTKMGLSRKLDALWWHFDESLSIPTIALDPKVVDALRNFVWSGHGLRLSLLAASYVVDLGFETRPPNIRILGTWSESSPISDYPDIRGFAGFGDHPIFKGFAGGLYTWAPGIGDRSAGSYYENEKPTSGKVVAVEKSYIKLDESRRVIIEYGTAKGRVLSVGAHLNFAHPNRRFRPHLEKFAANCLTHLAADRTSEKNRRQDGGTARDYWNFDPPTVAEFVHTSRPIRKPNVKLPRASNDLVGYRDLAASDKEGEVFSLSGRRILVMGRERAGIAEVWSHPIRALRDLKTRYRIGDRPFRTGAGLSPIVAIRPESLTRQFSLDDATIEETIFTDLHQAAGIVHYQTSSTKPVELLLTAKVDLRYMWPLSEHATGSLRFAWNEHLRAAIVTDLAGKASSVLGCSATPSGHLAGQYSDISLDADQLSGTPTTATEVTIGLRVLLSPGRSACAFVFSGSGESVHEAIQSYQAVMLHPAASLTNHRRHSDSLERHCVTVVTPDGQFNKAYRWALVGLDKFFVETPALGSSLMAGYGFSTSGWDGGHALSGRPGYAWYFGRDSAWASLALLDCGDYSKVRGVLEFLGRCQDEDGKILHELTTSGHAHYDAADSTPLYLYLMGRYVRATGDRAFARAHFPAVQKAVEYCSSTDTDNDHFIENTNAGHGWVEGGQLFPAHAEHYLVSCWTVALRESAFVAKLAGKRYLSARWQKEARTVSKNLEKEFWNRKTRFYNFAKLSGGSFNEEKTILPTVGMYLGCADHKKAQTSLFEYASDAFSADWGVRIISRSSPLFNPSGYHYGSIWPLFTGWTALAEFALGRPVQGYMHLANNLRLYDQFSHGSFEEVLHGQRFQPEGVCAHQAWSDSMALQPVIEGLLGLKIDAIKGIIEMRPYLPPHWPTLSVRGIRLGKMFLRMDIRRGNGETVYSFYFHGGNERSRGTRVPTLNFTPVLPLGTFIHEIWIGTKKRRVNFVVRDYRSLMPLNIRTDKRIKVRVVHNGGISVIPPVPNLRRGQESTGLRILDERWRANTYCLTVEGQKGREYLLDVKDYSSTIKRVEGAPVLSRDGDRLILVVQFKGNPDERAYERREIRIAT